jgi:hypothetical protein
VKLNHRPLVIVATLAAAVTLTSCSGTPAPAAKTGGESGTTTTPTTTVPPSPSSTTTAPAAPKARTSAQLKKALLKLDDLPSGFSLEPGSGGDSAPRASSKDPKCASFVKLSNADTAPGSTANAAVSFSAGQDGPFIDEAIDALGSAAKVAALQAKFKAAIAACDKVTLSVPGAGTSTVAVRSVKPPAAGDHPLAARMTATSGPLEGLEIVMVTTGVRDTVISLSFVGATPDDIDGATGVSVDKATEALPVASTS